MPGAPGEIRFYTREGCHLCHGALGDLRRVLRRLGLEAGAVEVIDIDRDTVLRERYNERVPVCYVGEEHVFDYRCDEAAVERALRRRAAT